jgi:cytochrome c-type biogenesis protein CcmE
LYQRSRLKKTRFWIRNGGSERDWIAAIPDSGMPASEKFWIRESARNQRKTARAGAARKPLGLRHLRPTAPLVSLQHYCGTEVVLSPVSRNGTEMTSIRAKLVVAGLVLVAAVSYLSYAGAKSGWVYYVEVDKAASDIQYRKQRVRLHGKVAQEQFLAFPARLSANFKLFGKTQSVAVEYHGALPDQFVTGRDVVVEGTFNQTGVFQADLLLTKCASKYEAKSPHAKAEGGKS